MVLDIGEGDAHAQLGCHEGEGVARGLGSQRRRTAEAGVHLERTAAVDAIAASADKIR